jgi:hypothetical protein
VDYRDKIMLEQSLEQCLEKRMDGSCRSHPPVEDQLLIWSDGKEYDSTTHTIKSRLTPEYNVALKQGLVATGNGTSTAINYGVRNLCSGGCADFTLEFRMINLGISGLTRYPIAGEYVTGGGTRGWSLQNFPSTGASCSLNIGKSDGTLFGTVNITFANAIVNGDVVKLRFTQSGANGLWTAYKNGTANGTGTMSGQNLIYSNSSNFELFKYLTTDFSNQTICDVKIYRATTLVFYAPLNGTSQDIVNGWTATDTAVTWSRSDNSSFRNDEYGFAVKTGVVYPKLLSGTGYAGLVGEPDAVYQGLIATKGQIEIAGQAYLKTLFDFEQTPNTVIEDAGISWDDWDNDDCNSDDVGTAETDLDTSYYSAITASLMTCEGMLYGGTSNVANRLFFRVTSKVMKADGTFLASSGTVTDILVYKRDLTADEMIRVLKWCKALPFTSVDLVLDGEGNFVVVDGNLTYACLGV